MLNNKSNSVLQYIIYSLLIIFMVSCSKIKERLNHPQDIKQKDDTAIVIRNETKNQLIDTIIKGHSSYEELLKQAGYVNIKDIDSSIWVDLKYSTTDNFMNEDLYGDFNKCFMLPITAKMLSAAQKNLKKIDKNLSLIIFDAVRPRAVQRKMWSSGKLPKNSKHLFLANPELFSLHNFGAAVDVSIVMADSTLLDMGTEFDHIGELAYPSLENYFLDNGILGYNQVENRRILRQVMKSAGFIVNKYEWWHFVSCYREDAIKEYAAVENFDSIIPPGKTIIPLEQKVDIIFKVQLAASTKKLKSSHPMLKGIDYQEYYHKGMYKYTSGEFNSLAATYEYRDSLRNRGYQAFVVCFNNDKRIDIREAIALLQ